MNHKEFLHFCQELLKLKEKLKCPICLEIISEHAELECGHRFCVTCISKHKSISIKPHVCPLCQKLVSRRSVMYKDKFGDALSNFMSTICRKVEAKEGTIEDVVCAVQPDDERIIRLENNKDTNAKGQLITEPTNSKTALDDKILRPKENIKKTKSEKLLVAKPSTSKAFLNDEILRPKENIKKTKPERLLFSEPSTSKAIVRKSPRIPQKDVKCGNTPKNVNLKKNTGKKSKNKPLSVVSQESDAFDKLLNTPKAFSLNKKGTKCTYTRKKKKENVEDETYYTILNFENTATKSAVVNWLNDNRNKFDRLTQTQHHVEEEHSESNIGTDMFSVSQINKGKLIGIENKLKKNCRSRSLDLEIKPKGNRDRNNSLGSGTLEDYMIEEINTEEIVKRAKKADLMRILEEQCLDDMEEKLAKKNQKEQRDNQITQSSSTGWQRAEKMTKTLGKKEKAPKKLNITLQHSQMAKEKKELVSGVKLTRANPGEGISSEKKNVIPEKTDKTVKDVNDAKETQKEAATSKADPKDPQNANFYDLSAFEHYFEKNMEPISKPQNESILSQNSDKENNENAMNVVKNRPEMENRPKIIILNDSIVKNAAEHVDPYLLPTQKLNTSDRSFEKANKNASNISDVNESFQELEDFGEVMATLLTNLKKYSCGLDENKQLTKRNIECIRKYLDKLNELHGMFQDDVARRCERIESGAQTENDVRECQTQTSRLTYCDAEVQTEAVGTGARCEKCNDAKKPTPENSSGSSKKSKNSLSRRSSGRSGSSKMLKDEDFAATLDLLNFETQEMEKQYLRKNASTAKDSQASNREEMRENSPSVPAMRSLKILLTNEEHKTHSSPKKTRLSSPATDKNPEDGVLVCSLKSDAEENRMHASVKRALSDSDDDACSDVVVLPKRRCNRFIRDDLSIEFGTTETSKKNSFTTGLSPESEEINDEEYLNKIIKKYVNGSEDGNSSPSLKKGEENAAAFDFDGIVARVGENVDKLSKLNDARKARRSQRSVEDDNTFLDDHHLKRLDGRNDVEDDSKEQTENSDIIPETEVLDRPPPRKKPKTRRLDEAFDAELSLGASTQQTASPVKGVKETYCQELEDDLDMDFGNIDVDEANKNSKKSAEEDLFSEEDVVECTPQKEKNVTERRSQQNVAMDLTTRFPALDDVDREIFENFEDIEFTPILPPPGFEDEEENAADASEEATMIDSERNRPEAETPPKKPPPPEDGGTSVVPPTPEKNPKSLEDLGGYDALDVVVHRPSHSTPLTQRGVDRETIALSPIVQEDSIFERSYSNTIVGSNSGRETPRKHNILTSDPKQKSILNYVRASQGSVAASEQQPKRKPCIACTRLGKEQIQSVSLLTNKKLATYSAKFNDSVTHMIVTVDKTGRIRDYTMKFVSAVAAGIWVVGFKWIQECLKANAIVPEEPYEVLDDSGGTGPKTSRLTRIERPLFKDYKFFCVNPLFSTSVEDVEDVIVKLGGIIVKNLENMKEKDDKIGLIITEGRSTQDFEIYEKWLEKYKIATVDIEWLSKSVGGYKLLSIRPYIWCSDDILCNLGYPPSLVESVNTSSECC